MSNNIAAGSKSESAPHHHSHAHIHRIYRTIPGPTRRLSGLSNPACVFILLCLIWLELKNQNGFFYFFLIKDITYIFLNLWERGSAFLSILYVRSKSTVITRIARSFT